MKRVAIILASAAISLGVLTLLWIWLDCPAPRLIVAYGVPPAGGPTGRVRILEQVEFLELRAGYYRTGSHEGCDPGTVAGRLAGAVGLDLGRKPRHVCQHHPPRWVEVDHPFWIARTEVTNGQYHRFCPEWEDYDYPEQPVVNVSPEQAEWFCRWLGEGAGAEVRLPTHEEWEYACLAGSAAPYCYDEDEGSLDDYAWHRGNVKDGSVHEVGRKLANAWGLYDFHGNAAEMTGDRWARGGSYASRSRRTRSFQAQGAWATVSIGFRPVAVFPEE